MSRPPRPFSPTAWALGAALLLAGCQNTAKLPPGADNPGLVPGRVSAVNPLEIAVPPVENLTGKQGLPLEVLRAHFHRGLVQRHYSPLALEYVDGRVVEAAYSPGACKEQGVLKIVLTGWDDTYWRTHSRLVLDADVWLLDPQNPTPSQALWGGHVQRRMEMARARQVTATDADLVDQTLREFSEAVLASLPTRNPEVATAR